jgi:hypothetical protein
MATPGAPTSFRNSLELFRAIVATLRSDKHFGSFMARQVLEYVAPGGCVTVQRQLPLVIAL